MKQTLIGLGIFLLILLIIEGIALLRLRAQLSDYREYWNTLAAAPVPEGALRYVALGDSAAQGIGASNPHKGYVGLIAQQLRETSDKPVHVTNLSVSGAKVKDAIDKQLPQLQQLSLPADTIITIEIGANDMLDYDAAKFETEIDLLFSQLPPQTVVSDMPYFGGIKHGDNDKAVLASKAIADAAQKYGLAKAELYEISKNNNTIRGYAADFFHPSDVGYQNWYRAFWHQLN